VLLAPMQFRATPLALSGGVPGLGAQHRAGSPR
jgi:hypothetical protein